MKQKLLDMLCTLIGHDWREKDDPDNRTCLTCGATKFQTNPDSRPLPGHADHAPAGGEGMAAAQPEEKPATD